jgi:hypothetical protein
MKIETYRCDNCEKSWDKDTNHWSSISGWCDKDGRKIWSGPFSRQWIEFGSGAMMSLTVHACGDDCRFALMSRFLATGSFKRRQGTAMIARPVTTNGNATASVQ